MKINKLTKIEYIMISQILKLKGVQELNKNEQKQISGALFIKERCCIYDVDLKECVLWVSVYEVSCLAVD